MSGPSPQPGALYLTPRMAALLALGFFSGLPAMLTTGTLDAWMTQAGVSETRIGLLALVTLPYALKPFWAPLMDRFRPLAALGRRRGWLLLCQGALALGVAGMAWQGPAGPSDSLLGLGLVALAVAFASASQDIAGDAYRTELLTPRELGAGASVWVTGYRLAMILASGGLLMAAPHLGWRAVYLAVAGLMGLGMVVTWWAPRLPEGAAGPATLAAAVLGPVRALAQAHGARLLLVLLFVLLFKLPDTLGAKMTMTFLLRGRGYSESQVGLVRQWLGLGLTIVGALAGGAAVARLGLRAALWLFGALQALSNLGFWALALQADPGVGWLVGVVSVEAFCGGLVTAGFLGFLMSLCDRRYAAFQFALLTAVASLSKATLGGAPAGYLLETLGQRWDLYYLVTVAVAVPGMALLPWVARTQGAASSGDAP